MKEVIRINESPWKDWFNGRTIPKHPNAALYSSCDTLVNSGILTAEGQRALGRIRNGAMLAGGGAGLLGVPVPLISKGLSLLAAGTLSEEIDTTDFKLS
jgi:hypothetical protein